MTEVAAYSQSPRFLHTSKNLCMASVLICRIVRLWSALLYFQALSNPGNMSIKTQTGNSNTGNFGKGRGDWQ